MTLLEKTWYIKDARLFQFKAGFKFAPKQKLDANLQAAAVLDNLKLKYSGIFNSTFFE